MIIRWPERIAPGTSDALVNQIDLVASFAALLGVELPEKEACDSRNILKAFLGEDPVGHTFMIEEAYGLALRHGSWKYIQPSQKKKGNGAQLFNLKNDVGEKNNIIASHPEVAERMASQLQEWIDAGRVRN